MRTAVAGDCRPTTGAKALATSGGDGGGGGSRTGTAAAAAAVAGDCRPATGAKAPATRVMAAVTLGSTSGSVSAYAGFRRMERQNSATYLRPRLQRRRQMVPGMSGICVKRIFPYI